MTPVRTEPSALTAPVLTRFTSGPVDAGDAPVVVSVTEFQTRHLRDLPGVALTGLQMRMGWYAMPGAVGLWLWTLPTSARGGSISVWGNDGDLERFVELPRHVDIMRRYGPRGTVRSTTWRADTFDSCAVIDRARAWISSGAS